MKNAVSTRKKLLVKYSYSGEDVAERRLGKLRASVESDGMAKTAEELGIGVPTLKDIISELEKPGRDLRDEMPAPILRDDIISITLDIHRELICTSSLDEIAVCRLEDGEIAYLDTY